MTSKISAVDGSNGVALKKSTERWPKKSTWPDCNGHESAALCDLFGALKGASESSSIPARDALRVVTLFTQYIVDMDSQTSRSNEAAEADTSIFPSERNDMPTGNESVPSPDKAAGIGNGGGEEREEDMSICSDEDDTYSNDNDMDSVDDKMDSDDNNMDSDDEEDDVSANSDDRSFEDDFEVVVDDQWNEFEEDEEDECDHEVTNRNTIE